MWLALKDEPELAHRGTNMLGRYICLMMPRKNNGLYFTFVFAY